MSGESRKRSVARWILRDQVCRGSFWGSALVVLVLLSIAPPGSNAQGKATINAGPLDPPTADPKHYAVEFENDHVRVIRVRYRAHEKGAVHKHPCGRVVVSLTDLEEVITEPDGKRSESRLKAGEVEWGGMDQHQGENLADRPFELILIDVKGACPAGVLGQ